ncbi:Co2+/Mg2+ efflux protein ApaG [Zunongwangia sp. SCSIO 43204]|uniref:ApaG protein n=1 Tax=Zunongwangia mangrovi TaxID=1334022 RepID=A0A1I1MWR1_9FLAO|nr:MULTISPECIES: Co2+/Mg2+ efflux protein ApaG [Zunongwangia]UAB84221.1 Co2+/Mg2+ efflux protein ApaG [Zunongwangia sp. SCSIO 43204]SFC87013.1 ApaG protein [Zunongwangia mangrovi]
MVEQITKGIKISVQTFFDGILYDRYQVKYAFGYKITIENQSNDSVQLKSRFWKIKDALNKTETVEGEGVIGKKPVIKPGEKHTYQSGCLLNTPFGAMSGYYNMINFTSTRKFRVKIPSFKLSAPFALN